MHKITVNLAVALMLIFAGIVQAQGLRVSERSVPVVADVDVLVVGGWSGGVAAAVAAAEAGATVFLVAPEPYLGADIAGAWRFWNDTADKSLCPLAREVLESPTTYSNHLLDYTYEFSSEPTEKLTDDERKRLKDGSLYGSHCLLFEDDVSVVLDLHETRQFNIINIWINQMYPDSMVAQVNVAISDDGQAWRPLAVKQNDRGGYYRKEPLRLCVEAEGSARYLRLHIEKQEGAKEFGLAEIQVFDDRIADELRPVPTPLDVKTTLERAMLDAGVDFLLGTYCTEVLYDRDGTLNGVLVSNRSGRQAIKAKVVIDASSRGVVARLAGAEFTKTSPGRQRFRFVTVNGIKASEATASDQDVLVAAGELQRPLISRGKPYTATEYWLEFDLADFSPATLADVEQQIRSAMWANGLFRACDMPWTIWPDRLVSRRQGGPENPAQGFDLDVFLPRDMDRLIVLGSCADLAAEAAEELMSPANFMAIGRDIGQQAVRLTRQANSPSALSVKDSFAEKDLIAGDLKEMLTGASPGKIESNYITVNAHTVPVADEYDVIVIGGGTAGAPAGIAAARYGARTLVVEYLHGLGGTGTHGRIANYWYGNLTGFSKEVDDAMGLAEREYWDRPVNRVWKVMQKEEWWRKEVLGCGADLWFGAIGCGAIIDDGLVKGVLIATEYGPRYVLAKCVVDATGSADIAIAAGSDYIFVDAQTIAYQGAGLPPTDLYVDYYNTDFAIVDELDTVDTTHLRVYGRNKYRDAFDVSSLICTRERRRAVGDFIMTVEDQLAERTYPDTIARTYSNHDSHGAKNALWYFLMPRPPKLFCDLPFRCMLPRGLNGLVVTGTGISVQHDALAILRMQADVQNQGYAAGVAAAMASRQANSVRGIDIKDLQRHLVAKGNIPAEVLDHKDNAWLTKKEIEALIPLAVNHYGTKNVRDIARLMVNAEVAVPMIRTQYLETADESDKLFFAHFLAIYGDNTGVQTLVDVLGKREWDKGGNTLGMSEVDRLVIAAGRTGDHRATPAVIEKLTQLDADAEFSHFQAVALACQNLKDPQAAAPLARLLAQEGMTGHHVTTIAEAAEQDYQAMRIQHNEFSLDARMLCDRELILARALLYCGDYEGMGKRILENYTRDLRGVYLTAAQASLDYAATLAVNQ